MAIEKRKPPQWWKDEEVEITCVAASADDVLAVFMFWRAAASLKTNEQDMFVLTFEEGTVLVNGAPIDASYEDIEILARMTDPLTMGPRGPQLGEPLTTRRSDAE